MSKSLLFIPDISGYTQFIQTTEVEHSQHVIAELLEVLIAANTEELKLAEVEGDALFFYKENQIPSQEKLLAQIESMYTAFYSHLRKFEKNRVCPCNACATAPNLKLKIIAHSGRLRHIEVQGNRKPFGQEVIEVHRLLKNSVQHDNYVLISRPLALEIQLSYTYSSKVFRFRQGTDTYDGKQIEYLYALIDTERLNLQDIEESFSVSFDAPPQLKATKTFKVTAAQLYEYISNYSYRHHWVKGVDSFEFNPNEVTRLGTEHLCVINGAKLDFVTVTKAARPNQLVYGEFTKSLRPVDELYQFYIVEPVDEESCEVTTETYWKVRSPIKKILMAIAVKRIFRSNLEKSLKLLEEFVDAAVEERFDNDTNG